MTDPAIEAAQRVWEQRYPNSSVTIAADAGGPNSVGAGYIAAAREALAPIRELHSPYTRNHWGGDGRTVCNHCLGPRAWPCPTARLVYPEDEL